jgi:chromosomal replication initiation ATPase DnaA
MDLTSKNINVAACMLVDGGEPANDLTWELAEKLVNDAMIGRIAGCKGEMRRFLTKIHQQSQTPLTRETMEFNQLMEIVSGIFGVEPEWILSKSRRRDVTCAKNAVAAFWAEKHSLQDTSKRMNWEHHGSVYHARRAMTAMFKNPKYQEKCQAVLAEIKNKNPDLLN